ncbi:hypothetical protein KKI22_02860 [Patescibacteria group bacterium]|nr:hypothetical protein [Patescibacteria group bacterium]
MFNSGRYSSIYDRKNSKKNVVSSRLVKREKSKIQKQTFLFVFFGIVFLLLFIFLIVPGLIRIFFSIIDKDSPFEEKDTVPPQVPVLSTIPFEATYSANLNLRGFAEPKSKVVFLLNSEKNAEIDVAEDGQFEYEINLNDGENELSIFGVDEMGNESLKTRSYLITRDSEAPSLEIEEPKDGTKIELKKNRTLTIKGKTEAEAKVLINGRLVLADKEGNFSSNYYLNEGKNELKFEVTDKAKNKTERSIEVEFQL